MIRIEDDSDDQSDNNDNEDDSDESVISSEEDETPSPVTNSQCRNELNESNKRPGIIIASLNMRGRQKDNNSKMRVATDWIRTNRITILALQETHLTDSALEELNLRYRHLKFLGSGLSTASGGIAFIVNKATGTPEDIRFEQFEKGRLGMLSLRYGSQELNIVNVYMPNHKAPQKEALVKLRRTMKARRTLWILGPKHKLGVSPTEGVGLTY